MFNKIHALFAFPAFDLDWPAWSTDEIRLTSFLLAFAFLLAIEAKLGLRQESNRVIRRSYLTNTGLFLLNDTLLSLVSVSSLFLIADRFAAWGLLGTLDDSPLKCVLAFVLLDLALYLWHRACHHFEVLWMLHKVHHSDRCMNVSTGLRVHLGELLLTTLLKALFIVVLGVDSAVVLANEAIMTLFVLFHHSDTRFAAESWLGRFIVTPSMHRLHHSTRRDEHDRNFGAVFSGWDRWFGTFKDQSPENIGLNFVKEQGIVELMKFGFTWHYTPSQQTVRAMIAEAAYYRAEKRGFAPGSDYLDWLEAEREIVRADSQ